MNRPPPMGENEGMTTQIEHLTEAAKAFRKAKIDWDEAEANWSLCAGDVEFQSRALAEAEANLLAAEVVLEETAAATPLDLGALESAAAAVVAARSDCASTRNLLIREEARAADANMERLLAREAAGKARKALHTGALHDGPGGPNGDEQ